MWYFQDKLPELIREPKPPKELAEEFRREVALSNSRRLKAVTWLLISSLIVYLVADYLTIHKAGAHGMWLGILVMRSLAMTACFVFLWLFGPLRSVDDIKPRHHWIWKGYTYFFLIYTSIIVAFMFPLKESIGPIYIFLLGPSAFIAMTTSQVTVLLTIGLTTVAGALFYFVPDASTVKFHLINAMIISWVSFAVAHITYRSSFRDFMNKKLIEQKNRELEESRTKAESANQAKSDFLAAISHEIRTPMNSILGMTEVALNTPLTSRQRDYVETTRESALHLLDVINDILDFSRIEARKLRLISAHFDLPTVVVSAMKTVRLQARQKGVQLDFETMEKTPRFLKGDPGRLRQILINLLGNAIKFTDEGDIRVTVGPWLEGCDDPDRPVGLRFSVKDTGAGIEKETIERIFDAFTQADGSASRSYGGSGLGLSICKSLVEAMGGEITAISRKGKGSEFIFTARFGVGDEERATEPALIEASWNQPLPIKPSRVLLVDDNALNVKVAKIHLERMNMDTTVAESGAEALLILEDQDFDLVLMDLEMPGMDGHETTRRIRNGEGAGSGVRNPDVPVLAVTAHALADVRSRCERCGMNGFVTKPVGFGELGVAMRHILGGDWQSKVPMEMPKQGGAAVLDIVHASNSLGVSQKDVRHLVPNAMSEIAHKYKLAQKAMQTNTLREVVLQAHTLKSVAASIGAEATRRAAVKLENASRREDVTLSLERLNDLQLEIVRLETAVGAL